MGSIRTWGSYFLTCLLAIQTPTWGQDAATNLPSVQEIEARLQELSESKPPNAELSVQLYQEALAALGRAAEAERRDRAFAAEAAEAPAIMSSLDAQPVATASPADKAKAESSSLPDLENQLLQAQSDSTAARAKLAEFETTAALGSKLRAELPEELTQTKLKLAASEEALVALPADEAQQPKRTLLLAQRAEYRASMGALETRRNTYEVRRDLLNKRRDRARLEVTRAEENVDRLKQLVDARRKVDGDSTAKSAGNRLDVLVARFPELKDLAEATQVQVDRRSGETGLPRRISGARAGREATRESLEKVRIKFRSARRRILVGELTEGMGQILRWDNERLPSPAAARAITKQLERTLSEAQLELIDTDESRQAFGDLDTATDSFLREHSPKTPSSELRSATREVLSTLRASHDAVLGDLETLTGELYTHKDLARSLLRESKEYREFIENRILWVRSSPPNPVKSALLIPEHLSKLREDLLEQFRPQTLLDLFYTRAESLVFLLLAVLGLFVSMLRLKKKRVEFAELVGSYKSDHFIYSIYALGLTVLLALPMPLLVWAIGWLLTGQPDADENLPGAVGHGLLEISMVWFSLRFLKELVSVKGLGSAHFRWNTDATAVVRRALRWFEPTVVVLGFGVLFFDRHDDPTWADSLGRLCFIGCMLALGGLAHKLVRARSLFLPKATGSNRSLIDKSWGLVTASAYGVPLILTLLSTSGYYYTAMQLVLRLRYSIGFAGALVLVNSLLLRWLFVTRRRLAVKQALEAKARREQESALAGVTETGSPLVDAEKIDIPAIDAQTRQLFKTSISLASMLGLFWIWSSVLPALRGLDRVQLLPVLSIVDSDAESLDLQGFGIPSTPVTQAPAAGSSQAQLPSAPTAQLMNARETSEGQQGLPSKLTLADVLLALLFALVTSIAAKNLPALLELSLLQRLPLDSGSRYAVSTIVRYFILLLGVSAVSGALGIGWQKIQWLAAALTFGLAFGLQEIFANFVSGLIILIERPIRVGDIVTVGGTEGRVTQLRMRATTILDWDRREYLVPNKEFITGSIINWTLSDPVTRLTIPVGIAYGSDTEKARRLMLKTATDHPLVLRDPEASAIFRSFGDSSLNFELRVFLGNRDLWPRVIDQLHSEIDKAFRNANIEIAFPQRDLHIRSAEGLNQIAKGEHREKRKEEPQ